MQVEISKVEDGKSFVNIYVSGEEVDAEATSIAKASQKNAKINGFRQGAAPVELIKTRYRDAIRAEVSQRLVYKGVSEALRKKELRNAFEPVLAKEHRQEDGRNHLGHFSIDGSFKFNVEFSMPPDVDVVEYKGLEVEVASSNFESWFSNSMLENQRMYGEKELAQKAAEIGDECVVDFEASIDGVPLEGQKEEDYRMIIGHGYMAEDFENAFIGKKSGDQFSVDVKFPAFHEQEVFAGKVVTFACSLKEVYEPQLHPLNDELAQLLSYSDLDQMKQSYKDMYDQQFSGPLRAQTFNAIMEKIFVNNDFDVPEQWVNAEMQNHMRRMNFNPGDNPEVLNSLRELATRTVKVAYILEKIYAKEPDIHLSAEEFKQIVDDEAAKQNITGDAYLEVLRAQGAYEGFVTFHEQQKTIDFLIANSKFKEKV